MPRKSAEAIAAELLVTPHAQRSTHVRPPDDIPRNVRALVDELLASQPRSHWRPGDEFLVEQHAQSIIAAREAFGHLQREGYVIDGRPNPWITIWEKATRASVALAAKLRLSPQQRIDGKKAARETSRPVGGLGISYAQLPEFGRGR